MAKEWGREPWTLEAEAPAIWIERWLVDRTARSDKRLRDNPTAGTPGSRKLI